MQRHTAEPIHCELVSADAFASFDHPPLGPQQAAIAVDILLEITRYRRIADPHTGCVTPVCQKCAAPHIPKVRFAIALGLPITFVLPAFPGKSPNPAKVLGTLPDMAERRALEFLQCLCNRVKRSYSPGARVILCSDGRVFSDVVGMRDEDVTAYQNELSKMIVDSGLDSISIFNLDDLYQGRTFEQMRAFLMAQYGEPLEALQASVRRPTSADDTEAHRLYCGITRFLFEDALFPGQKKSRTALQKECRSRAYQVMQRSKAWGELVEMRFPNAVRLSIHPQTCGSKKLGIRLIEPDNWLTPWHGVAIDVGGRFMLLKRWEAEKLGAHLIHREGRPSHYLLPTGTQWEEVINES